MKSLFPLITSLLFFFSPALSGRETDSISSGNEPNMRVKPEDFDGDSVSEKIESALSFLKKCGGGTILFKDQLLYKIDRAILLPSNVTMILDSCTVKLNDGIFDNIIRSDNFVIDEQHPFEYVKELLPASNIKIIGKNGAVIEGAENFYEGTNPKTGLKEKWLGDFWGWRNFSILFSNVKDFEIAGFELRKTHSWGIVITNGCRRGHIHTLQLNTRVKNGDGIDIIQGCSHILIENITGYTSDDTIVFGAFDESRWSNANYIYPLLPVRYSDYTYGCDVHDIVCRDVHTCGIHHVLIILPSATEIYNIYCSDISDTPEGKKRKIVRIYGNGQYGQGFKPGNMHHIFMNGIVSYKAEVALEFCAPVYDSHFNHIEQDNRQGTTVMQDSGHVNTTISMIKQPEM